MVLDRVSDKIKKRLFGEVRTNKLGIGKAFTGCSDTLSQSIGRGRISRVGSLAVRESQDRFDRKSEQNIQPKDAVLA